MLLHLPERLHRAEPVRDAPRREDHSTLPEQLRGSLTWDQGTEMGHGTRSQIAAGIDSLLLRPALALAARHQREHQRPAAPVLPDLY